MSTDYKETWDITTQEGSLCFASAIYSRLVGGDQDESELLWLAEYLRVNSTALAQPGTEGPTNEELYQFWESHPELGLIKLLRAGLNHFARPTIKPVPVAERLPGPEDCDARGWCWYWRPGEECWEMVPVVTGTLDEWTHWLPHHALPLPQP